MFQKEGSSTIGGKKDVPLRKSDRRRLRDRVVDALFVGGNENAEDEEWITRAEKLIDDAIIASKGGDTLSRKLKLPSGEHATLFLRTPSGPVDSSSPNTSSSSAAASYDDILKSFPTVWPYHESIQPILLEYEDADRKVHLTPLLPLLAALPPPLSSPPLEDSMTYKLMESPETAKAETTKNDTKKYRIPNIIVHPAVSKYICRGADLMKSGIRSFPPPWLLRQSKGLVTISIIGNPQPVAIGMIENGLFREYCYSKNGNPGGRANWRGEANNLVGMGKKGVGVMILNCYGDDLWKNSLPSKATVFGNVSTEGAIGNPLGGGVYDDGNFGNRGFVDGMNVYPILEMGGDGESSSDEDEDGNENEDATAEMKQLNLSDNNTEEPAVTSEGAMAESATNCSQEDGNIEKDQEAEPEPDQNDILENAFYASLLILLSSKTPLPMPVSIYYGKHLLAAVSTTGPRLDMKQTTHKKIGPFLRGMESDGVITLGASKDGKDRCAFLTGIVKSNPELIQFKRNWKKEGGGEALMAVASTSQKTKLAVVDLFIVPHRVSEGLQLDKDAVMAVNAKTDERKGTGFLTKKECCALIETYIEKEDLIDPKGKGRVLVNGPLCDALYRISKKSKQSGQKPAEYPTSVKRKDLVVQWMEKMEKCHALVQMPGSKILQLGRGGPKPVDIEVEFRQGNRRKFNTRVRGMEEYGVDGERLSQNIAQRFACSSSVETNPVGRPALKKGRVELVLQGHLSEELTALLTGDESLTSHGGVKGSEYSLPKSVINVVLRKGIPARKRR